MKTLKFIIVGIALFLFSAGSAQISVNINIGSPPQWGPVGYTEARYYYLPDIETYYDVQSSVFIYYEDGAWFRRTYLPTRYQYYDLYRGYKVVLTDYRGEWPYAEFKQHKIKYAKGYGGYSQKTIGENPKRGNYKKKFSNDNSKKVEENRHGDKRKGSNEKKESPGGNTSNKGHGNGHDKGKNK